MSKIESENPLGYKNEFVSKECGNAVKTNIDFLTEYIGDISQRLNKEGLTSGELEEILDDLQGEMGNLNFDINNIRRRIVNSREK